ncbi:MAG TPA: hypothetical protein VGG59_02940, partial [Acidobacteriaceae bacterium]
MTQPGRKVIPFWGQTCRERDLHRRPAQPPEDTVALTEEALTEMPLLLSPPVPEPPALALVHAAAKPKQKPSPLWRDDEPECGAPSLL